MNKQKLLELSSVGFSRDMELGILAASLLEAVDQTGVTRKRTLESVEMRIRSMIGPPTIRATAAKHRIHKPDNTSAGPSAGKSLKLATKVATKNVKGKTAKIKTGKGRVAA